jgi:hypothetical protein
MTFKEYQYQTQSTAVYPTDQGIYYTALGLAGEAGEVANTICEFLGDAKYFHGECYTKEQ